MHGTAREHHVSCLDDEVNVGWNAEFKADDAGGIGEHCAQTGDGDFISHVQHTGSGYWHWCIVSLDTFDGRLLAKQPFSMRLSRVRSLAR
jgi:hypothetical protein